MSDELAWFKSSYSSSGGGECLEVAHEWRNSSYSDSEGSACLDVALSATHLTHIRDSKNPKGPHLTVPAEVWADFVTYAVQGK